MQEIDHFLQRFFCFILTGYILKCDSGRFFHIHLGIALANAHHTATLCHTAHQHHAQTDHDHKWNNVDQKIHHHIRCRIRYLLFILNTCFIQSVRKGIILHNTGIILLPCHITEQACTFIAAVLTVAVVVICYRTFDHIALGSAFFLAVLHLSFCLRCDHDLVILDHNFLNFPGIYHVQELVIGNLLGICVFPELIQRKYDKRDQHNGK